MNRNTYKKRIHDAELVGKVRKGISEVLEKHIPSHLYATLGLTEYQREEIENMIYSCVFEDLLALASKDPAAKGSSEYVLKTYLAFRAMMYYRIANIIYDYEDMNQELRAMFARRISEYAKVETMVDIHPAARIGRRFVIDHGVGTVIGETCKIGDDCYILNGVTLGATRIADNIPGNRHPTIGNKVQIGAFARIFGFVTIGDDVFISPHCVVTHDIPPNTKVVVVNQLQITRPKISTGDAGSIEVYGIIPEENGVISIYGKGFTMPSISLLDENFQEVNDVEISIIFNNEKQIKVQMLPEGGIKEQVVKEKLQRAKIKIKNNKDSIIVTESMGLKRAINTLIFEGGIR